MPHPSFRAFVEPGVVLCGPPCEDKREDRVVASDVRPGGYDPVRGQVTDDPRVLGCRQQVSQWVGRCPGCGQWGTIDEVRGASPGGVRSGSPPPLVTLASAPDDEQRVSTGFAGIDRVLGGGFVPASVALFAGEPGIGKSTLLLHVLAHLSGAGRSCVLVSGEESHAQVAARSPDGSASPATPSRSRRVATSPTCSRLAREARPFLLAIDSIQTLRDTSGTPDARRPVPGSASAPTRSWAWRRKRASRCS